MGPWCVVRNVMRRRDDTWGQSKPKLDFCQISLHQLMNQFCCIGAQLPSAVSNVKRGACGGTLLFAARWWLRAVTGLHLQVESMIIISAPREPSVLELGIWKRQYVRPLGAMPRLMKTEWDTCWVQSKLELMSNLPKRQHDQKAMHAMARTAASNTTERLRKSYRAWICWRVTGSHFARYEDSGAEREVPSIALFSVSPPCHSAEFTWCHSLTPAVRVPPLFSLVLSHVRLSAYVISASIGYRTSRV